MSETTGESGGKICFKINLIFEGEKGEHKEVSKFKGQFVRDGRDIEFFNDP